MVEPPLRLREALQLVVLEVLPKRHQRKRRRKKRVRQSFYAKVTLANTISEKEESDEDMGFGLFD